MNIEQMKQVLAKIKEYQSIIVFRHKRPDGDAVGSTKGLCEILRASYPEKEIYLLNSDYSDYVAFLGDEDAPVEDEVYARSLGIVLDTATTDRISNAKFSLCREIVRVDHHIDVGPYGDVAWVEPERSSTCEMIVAFWDAFREELKINRAAATYLYTGMVTDSGRFRFRSVSGDTMRYAGMLLDEGVDADLIYSQLYTKELNVLHFQGYMYGKIKRTENGVAYLYVSRRLQKRFGLSHEDAGSAVSYMDGIRGSLIWAAFIECEDGSIRVRLRSRFVTVNTLAEKYRGGGHDCACGATVYSKKEVKALLADADARLKEYKENNEGWL